ncbi:uncharacterized protein PHALS_06791 [Plasmopara halstedii]|uniref:Uncharacterized protein n=1 Tax=Plasmopara halstedii TaxID=4781 RepID=A0A0P1B4P2_PLAHL|nr:uncharacterized protein PHALS_06791 [Plasmopara halstedii]CEG49001.1 hypothetical protein PHALS_06791 [Plasmopara halstedii]|eukprot:XP_024585370.1 hypothetical protein PHALS_06791 [Plasmopara halstedii]
MTVAHEAYVSNISALFAESTFSSGIDQNIPISQYITTLTLQRWPPRARATEILTPN